MVNSHELRLGNLVLFRGEVDTVCGIGIGNGNCRNNGYFNDDKDYINPIPMTPDWLNKLDIKFSEGLGCNYPFAENFNLYLTKRVLKSVECTIMQYSEGDEILAHIEYVHQFQNLYFALTGKELKIKELQP